MGNVELEVSSWHSQPGTEADCSRIYLRVRISHVGNQVKYIVPGRRKQISEAKLVEPQRRPAVLLSQKRKIVLVLPFRAVTGADSELGNDS
jgi:hypothetical protein